MKKIINLTIATDISGKGGISTVLQILNQHNFFITTNSTLITSHCSSGGYFELKRFAYFFFSLVQLLFYAVFYKLGVVHVHMASRGSYIRKSKILRLAKFFGAKTILHLHGAEFETFYNKECSASKKQHIRDTFNMADKVIVLSTQWLAWVNTIVSDKTKTCIVYNAVPEVALPKKSTQLHNILFLGRLGQRKGVEDLITAFAQIAEEFPNTQLHLGGDGEIAKYQAQAKTLGVEKQVIFLGWVAGEKKNQCLADATIYCLPSYNEGFPMGVLEAMSAGVAVVASTAGGIPDAITDHKEGLLVEAGNINALAIALTTLLADDRIREQYATAAKVKFKNNFSPDVIIPQLKGIYQKLLEENQ